MAEPQPQESMVQREQEKPWNTLTRQSVDSTPEQVRVRVRVHTGSPRAWGRRGLAEEGFRGAPQRRRQEEYEGKGVQEAETGQEALAGGGVGSWAGPGC